MPGNEPGHAIRLSVLTDQPVVQTGLSRLYNVRDLLEDDRHRAAGLKSCVSVVTANLSAIIREFVSSLRWLADPQLAKRAKAGGADRDRTDDLKLAKLALSQLSYGPGPEHDCLAEP
jgi:hypothetical protein